MDLFKQQWATYRTVVDHDLMEHQAATAATAAALDAWFEKQAPGSVLPSLVDLGCGDLHQLAPLLRRLPLGCYTGIDLAEVVLPMAEKTLGPVPYPRQWQNADLLSWILSEPASDSIDLLHSAFAIHHLNDEQKKIFLTKARQIINDKGLFIWLDVFREPGELHSDYLKRYCRRIQNSWHPLSSAQKKLVINHVCEFDQPPDRKMIKTFAESIGWRWHWAWRGGHAAEAIALLSPA
ncbi:MAG: trans-aconitate 2-methyltransferase [Prochlorococcus sp.]